MSQHVAALQRETGLALVTRVGRGTEPTAVGLALAEDWAALRIESKAALEANLRAAST